MLPTFVKNSKYQELRNEKNIYFIYTTFFTRHKLERDTEMKVQAIQEKKFLFFSKEKQLNSKNSISKKIYNWYSHARNLKRKFGIFEIKKNISNN